MKIVVLHDCNNHNKIVKAAVLVFSSTSASCICYGFNLLMFFELVSILFAIVPDYGNEYMTKENKN